MIDRPVQAPHGEGHDRARQHRGDEVARHDVRQALDRRAAALRLGHHRDDLRQQRLGTDPFGSDQQRTRAVDGRAGDGVALALADGDGLTRDHRLVDGAAALEDDAVDRDLLARPHAQSLAGANAVEGYVLLRAVLVQTPRRLRCEAEQCADRSAGLAARAQLEHLTEQD
jgi:hypothetical protein